MSRDTVLVISTSFPLAADGSEAAGAFVADFVLALSALVPVRVIGPGIVEGQDLGSAYPVWRFRRGPGPLSLLSPMKPWHWPQILRALFSLRKQAMAAVADGRVSHIHALWVLPSGWVARMVARKIGATYSVWALGSDIWSLGRIPVVRNLLASVARDADLAYADGIKLGIDAQSLCGRAFEFLPSARVLTGVRQQPVAEKPPYRLLFIGRWHPNKGIDLLFDALDSLLDNDWSHISEVHIAGGGPLRNLVTRRAAALAKAGRPLRLSGFLGRAEAESALAEADRLLLPSRIESIPVIFSDALIYRLPVVAMPVGDLPELLSQGGGWLATDVSAPAFAAAITKSLCSHANPVSATCREKFEVAALVRTFSGQLAQTASK